MLTSKIPVQDFSIKVWIILALLLYAGCAPFQAAFKKPVPEPPEEVIEDFTPAPQEVNQCFSPPITVFVKEPSAHIRSGAGKDFKIITSAKKGAALKVFKREDQWYYVQLSNNTLGYIFMPLTSEDKPGPVSTPGPAVAPAEPSMPDNGSKPVGVTGPAAEQAKIEVPNAPNKTETPDSGNSIKPPWLK